MKHAIKIIQLVALLSLTPVYLAANQSVPTLSTYQNIMLLCTIGAFGMIMVQFWLTRSKLLGLSEIPTATVIRCHKLTGILAGGFLLSHPFLMVARRFQNWRHMHGALSLAFLKLALWHIVSVGRHSNTTMSAFWIIVCGISAMPLISSWIPEIYLRHNTHKAKT